MHCVLANLTQEKSKEVEVTFAGQKKKVKGKGKNKIGLLKIGESQKRYIAAPYQMKIENKDYNKLHNRDDISESVKINWQASQEMAE